MKWRLFWAYVCLLVCLLFIHLAVAYWNFLDSIPDLGFRGLMAISWKYDGEFKGGCQTQAALGLFKASRPI